MSVFMGIEMGNVDTGALEFLQLSESLALDVIFADHATEHGLYEVEERGTKGLAVCAEKSRNALRMRNGDAIGEDDVTAHAKSGMRVSDGDCIVERGTCCHERGRSNGFSEVKFRDGAVDTCCEAKIVSVDNKASSHEGLSQSIEPGGV
jgi:hypothetical protein